MSKNIGFVIPIVGITLMLAANASAVTISVNGTIGYNSGGLEHLATSDPNLGSYYAHVDTGANVELLGVEDPGPGSYTGANYLLLEKDTNVSSWAISSYMYMGTPATTGDQVSANFALYMDSTKTELIDNWDLGPTFGLTTATGGSISNSRTWLSFVPQSPYYVAGGTNPNLIDWSGAQANDMALAYYNGSSWEQVLATEGAGIFASFDEWHEVAFDYTVGGTHTVTVNGVTSSEMVTCSSGNTNDVIGLRTFPNGNTAAAGYYIEPLDNAITVNGTTVFDPISLQGNQIIPTVGNNSFHTTLNSSVAVLDPTSSGPGANEGSKYLALEKDANVSNVELDSYMLLDTPATNGDQISAEFAFYMDSTKTDIVDSWDLCAGFSFATGEGVGMGEARTWVALAPQSPYYLPGGAAGSMIDWTDATASDMALVYHNGTAWEQVLTAEGDAIFVSFDEWHDIKIDYTAGGTHSVTVDDATSDALLSNNDANTKDIIGLRTFINGNTAAGGFYLDALNSVQIPGDANNDGKVDGSDVTILAGNWQAGVPAGDPENVTWSMGDFNGDGKVDGSDVTILAGNWQYGVTSAAAAVPEPSVLITLLALAGSSLFWRFR